MYIVGTPRRTVAFSERIVETTFRTSKKSDGNTIELPCTKDARKPKTKPKQWNRGGGQQIMSAGVRCIASPTKRALLRRLLRLLVRLSLDIGEIYSHVA